MPGKKVLLALKHDMYARMKRHSKANFMVIHAMIINTLRKCVSYASEAKKGLQKRMSIFWSTCQTKNRKA